VTAGSQEAPGGAATANTRATANGSATVGSTAACPRPSPLPAPPPPALPADAGPRERVAHALAVAERALDANFVEAWQTLDVYPAEAKHREAVSLLRAYLGGRQAEAELRLGRTTAARRRWGAMLTDDPLHPAVLRNLAVAHTSSGDLGPAAQTWSRYLEALYLRDLLNGDIRRGAAERAEVHRVLAGSFGTAPLCARSAPDGELDGDLRQMAPVLAAAGKVGIAVTHLRLEELNHTLSQRGPTLLLGVGRSVGEADLDAARDRRTAAVETAVQALPARVRGPFEKQCRRMIDEAHREASETHGRTRRPGDEAEERAHLEWTRGRILWKLRISKAVMGADADWPLTEYSGDVIANLRLIDELPLDPADEVLLRSVHQLGVQGDPKEFVERHNQLSELACRFALGQIFAAAEETASGTATRHFPDRFRRTCRSWGRNAGRHSRRVRRPPRRSRAPLPPVRQIGVRDPGEVRGPRRRPGARRRRGRRDRSGALGGTPARSHRPRPCAGPPARQPRPARRGAGGAVQGRARGLQRAGAGETRRVLRPSRHRPRRVRRGRAAAADPAGDRLGQRAAAQAARRCVQPLDRLRETCAHRLAHHRGLRAVDGCRDGPEPPDAGRVRDHGRAPGPPGGPPGRCPRRPTCASCACSTRAMWRPATTWSSRCTDGRGRCASRSAPRRANCAGP
jgi:hypothetical protein